MPTLNQDDVRELGRCAASINAAATMIAASNWQGKAPCLSALQHAIQVVARLYNRAEPEFLRTALARRMGITAGQPEQFDPNVEQPGPPRKAAASAEA